MLDMPYFMENREWFRFDYDKRKYVLTDKVPDKARESYKEYMDQLEKMYHRETQ